MNQHTVRTVELIDVPVPVSINHGHLAPGERVEDSTVSMESLLFTVKVRVCGPYLVKTWDDIVNYASIYRWLREHGNSVISDPIEKKIDELALFIETECEKHMTRLLSIGICVTRPGLLDGIQIRATLNRVYRSTQAAERFGKETIHDCVS